jgi:hypothetical protein
MRTLNDADDHSGEALLVMGDQRRGFRLIHIRAVNPNWADDCERVTQRRENSSRGRNAQAKPGRDKSTVTAKTSRGMESIPEKPWPSIFLGLIITEIMVNSSNIITVIVIMDGEMGGSCSTHGKYEMYARFSSKNLKGRDHSEDTGVDGRIILDWILK